MAKIAVNVRSDKGDLGIHPKHGQLIPGSKLTIEEEDFAAELFERPKPDFLSPHEEADKARAAELGRQVGHQDPPPEPPQFEQSAGPEQREMTAQPSAGKKAKEVTLA